MLSLYNTWFLLIIYKEIFLIQAVPRGRCPLHGDPGIRDALLPPAPPYTPLPWSLWHHFGWIFTTSSTGLWQLGAQFGRASFRGHGPPRGAGPRGCCSSPCSNPPAGYEFSLLRATPQLYLQISLLPLNCFVLQP